MLWGKVPFNIFPMTREAILPIGISKDGKMSTPGRHGDVTTPKTRKHGKGC